MPDNSTDSRDEAQPDLDFHLWSLRQFIGRTHVRSIGMAATADCEDAHESLDFVLRSLMPARPNDTPAAHIDADAGDPVSKLRLPVALLNRLNDASISTIAELAAKSERDLWRARGVGRKFVVIIKAQLAAAGFQLAEDPS